jgi:N-acetyl-1-D-myo-inositol-2-amino-2-deoxy-alpha-D-glucopyranoside deacetylase
MAMEQLGVSDFVRLGGDGRYRDSGMAWDATGMATVRAELRSGIFWGADLLEAALELVPLIRSRRPQVMITYNPAGGYFHPDHIQTHRVAMYAYQLAAVPGYRPDLGKEWQISRVLWGSLAASRLREALRELRAAGNTTAWEGMDPEGDLPPFVAEDADIDVQIDGTPWVRQKLAAMRAHATQITPDGNFFAGESVLGDRAWSHEYYKFAAGIPFPQVAGSQDVSEDRSNDGSKEGWADDIFAGLP